LTAGTTRRRRSRKIRKCKEEIKLIERDLRLSTVWS